MKFGENLKNIRKSKKISQEDLADTLGVSRQSVSKWETGENYPSMQNIMCLCTIFKCKMNDLVHEDFSDIDFLGEDVKMNVVKLNEKEQKKMKTFSKILSVLGKIANIGAKIAMVVVIFIMIVVPILFSKLEIKNNTITYKNSVFEVNETSSGIEVVLDGKDNIKFADLSTKDIESVKKVIAKRNNYLTSALFELGMSCILVLVYLVSKLGNLLDKLFTNIHEGDTPFTLDNVGYIKKMSYLMIACIILPIFGELFLDLAILQEVNVNIELFNGLEIIFLYAISLIFEYGYRIQQDSNGKMYNKEVDKHSKD